MPRRIHLEAPLSEAELGAQYRGARDPVERSRWHFLWLLARGLTATAVAAITGYSAYWIGQIARRDNQRGAAGVHDRRRTTTQLRTALKRPSPEGDRWCGRTVAAWIGAHLGKLVCRQTGWSYLRRLGARWRKPRPRDVRADPVAQAIWKAHLRPLLRQVATAFPRATIEL